MRWKAKRARRLEERCEEILASLDLGDPLTIDTVLQAAVTTTGRPLYLYPILRTEGMCGALLREPDIDVLFHDAEASPLEQLYDIAHEIGHVLLGHLDDEPVHPTASDLDELAEQAPDLSRELVERLATSVTHRHTEDPPSRRRRRATHGDTIRMELEANTFALLLVARAAEPTTATRWRTTERVGSAHDPLAAAIDFRPRQKRVVAT